MFGPTTQGSHGPVSSTLIKFVSLDFSQLILNDIYLGSSEKFSSRFLIFRLEWHCLIPCTPGWRTVGVYLHLKMLEHPQSRINCCKFGVSGSGFSSVIVAVHLNGDFLLCLFIDWLVVCCLTSHSGILQAYGVVIIISEGLQILGFAWRLLPLSREGSLLCHTHWNTS